MSKLSKNILKRFIVTCEVAPPKGAGIENLKKEIKELKKIWPKIEGINVVDNPGSILLMGSLAVSIMLKQNKLEPIYQLTCRDRNVLGLQSDLLGAAAFGIENVLAITGDHTSVKSSDHPKAKPVFDLDSSTLIKAIVSLNNGKDFAGNKLNKNTNFFIGSAINPGVTPIDGEIYKTKRKLLAGSEFFQTQVVFNPSVLDSFLAEYEKTFNEDVRKRVLMGILPIDSYDLIKFLRTIPGLSIPDEIENRIKRAKNQFNEGVQIALELVDSAKDLNLGGVHVVPAGKSDAMLEVLKKI